MKRCGALLDIFKTALQQQSKEAFTRNVQKPSALTEKIQWAETCNSKGNVDSTTAVESVQYLSRRFDQLAYSSTRILKGHWGEQSSI